MPTIEGYNLLLDSLYEIIFHENKTQLEYEKLDLIVCEYYKELRGKIRPIYNQSQTERYKTLISLWENWHNEQDKTTRAIKFIIWDQYFKEFYS